MPAHSDTHIISTHTSDFGQRFKKNLGIELVNAKNILTFIIISSIASMMFVLEFPMVKKVLGFVFPFFILYFGGKYLTLLPGYLVIILTWIPKKLSYPVLGVSILLSLFMVFLV